MSFLHVFYWVCLPKLDAWINVYKDRHIHEFQKKMTKKTINQCWQKLSGRRTANHWHLTAVRSIFFMLIKNLYSYTLTKKFIDLAMMFMSDLCFCINAYIICKCVHASFGIGRHPLGAPGNSHIHLYIFLYTYMQLHKSHINGRPRSINFYVDIKVYIFLST